MKKIVSFLLTIPMVLSMMLGTTAFAAETTESVDAVNRMSTQEEVVPYGAISGSGQMWFNPNTMPAGGSFAFNVTGIDWFNAHITLKFENFSPDTKFDIEICNRNGNVVFRRIGIDMSFDDYNNLLINPGLTGTYVVYYKFYGKLSSGRISVSIT